MISSFTATILLYSSKIGVFLGASILSQASKAIRWFQHYIPHTGSELTRGEKPEARLFFTLMWQQRAPFHVRQTKAKTNQFYTTGTQTVKYVADFVLFYLPSEGWYKTTK